MTRAYSVLAASSIAVVLAACSTSVGDTQAKCEQQTPNFQAMTTCLERELRNDGRYGSHDSTDLVRLYISFANKLAGRVRRGEISEADAELSLARLYSDLKDREINRETQESLQDDSTTCIRNGNMVTCY